MLSRSRPLRAGKRIAQLPMQAKASMGSFAFECEVALGAGVKARPEPVKALARHYLKRLKRPRGSLSILLCKDAQSRRLNRRFRGKDRPTDVLSFPAFQKPLKAGPLGDLALNLPYIRRKAPRFADDARGDFALLLLHGILHLLGYHHDNARAEAALWRLKARHFPPPARLLKGLPQ